MKKCLLVVILSYWFCFNSSASSYRSLSLEMLPDVHFAHWWLSYDDKAFDEKWLKKEVACHFVDENDECLNLAALLRMYAAAVPNKKHLKTYAYEIKDRLNYYENHELEVALFLFLYADDDNLNSIIVENDIEIYDEPYVPDSWDAKKMLGQLNSEVESEVLETIKLLIDQPYNKSMHIELLEPMVALSADKQLNDARYYANKYLIDMGYLTEGGDGQGQGDPDEIGRVTITSGVIELAEYLERKPISKIWKYHAKNISADLMNERNFSESQLVHFFEGLTYSDDPELNAKINFIKKTNAYKTAKPSMKFMIAGHLMYEHQEHGLSILKEAYKQGNNAMKSSIVAQYPELFPVKKNFWQKLAKQSSAAELVLVEKNKAFWEEQTEVDE